MGLEGIFRLFYDFIFPPSCLLCENPSSQPVCESCFPKLSFIRVFCELCGKPTSLPVKRCSFCRGRRIDFIARSLLIYDDETRKLIHSFKFNFHRCLASFFTYLLLERHKNFLRDVDVITFVPMHPRKLLKRGYNQSFILAREISRALNVNLENVLFTTRLSQDQIGLRKEEREDNVKGVYKVKKGSLPKIREKTILLVDDVFTTGSTVGECSKALKSEGEAKKVKVISLARKV